MFPNEDLPLFSGTTVPTKPAAFRPAQVAEPAAEQTDFLTDETEITTDEARAMLRELRKTPARQMDEKTYRLVLRLEAIVGA